MSRLAILTDIHANLHALDAVLAQAAELGIRRFVCLGDIVGYNAYPRQCLERILALDSEIVLGNHDEFASQGGAMLETIERHPAALENPVWAGIRHAILELGEATAVSLGDRPFELRTDHATFAHASLHAHGEWPYLHSVQDALPTLTKLETPVGFFGHTHRPAVFDHPHLKKAERPAPRLIQLDPEGKTAIVVGSVGQPRNGDPAAQWAIFDREMGTVLQMRTPYDVEAAARAVIDAGLPAESAIRLHRGA